MSTQPEQTEVRIFERKVDGEETKVRHVTSESGAVAARFDGYFEKSTGGKATGTKAAAAGDSTKAANNAG